MESELIARRVEDFAVTGDGAASAWEEAEWQSLTQVGNGDRPYAARFKTVYSATGLYFLFECEDKTLTCSDLNDFDDLFLEDVIEVFLWPEESQHVYFEYEISPLNVELPLLISNMSGQFMGWRPWHYEGERRTRKATSARNGSKTPGTSVEGWSAEFFIPFALLRGLGNVPPESGTRWRVNMYRIDYDGGQAAHYAWRDPIGASFHNFHAFGYMLFS